jgi:hypothetical protein
MRFGSATAIPPTNSPQAARVVMSSMSVLLSVTLRRTRPLIRQIRHRPQQTGSKHEIMVMFEVAHGTEQNL